MKKLLLLMLALSLWTAPAWAACLVDSGTFPTGHVLRDVLCDTSGNQRVVIGGSAGGGLGTATAAAPTLAEGAAASFSFDLAGNARFTLGTLISGEEQTFDLLKTSGGSVRTTTFSSVTSATSSTVTTVPTGAKTFMGQIINATSETKAATVLIYGNWTNSTTGGILLCTLTLPSTVTVLQLQDACPVVTANFAFYYYTATVYTSASSAPFTLYAMY